MNSIPPPPDPLPSNQTPPESNVTDFLEPELLNALLTLDSLESDIETLFADLSPLTLTDVYPFNPEPLLPSPQEICLTHIATTKALLYHLQAVVSEFVPSPGISPHPLSHLTQQLLESVEATQLALGDWAESSRQ